MHIFHLRVRSLSERDCCCFCSAHRWEYLNSCVGLSSAASRNPGLKNSSLRTPDPRNSRPENSRPEFLEMGLELTVSARYGMAFAQAWPCRLELAPIFALGRMDSMPCDCPGKQRICCRRSPSFCRFLFRGGLRNSHIFARRSIGFLCDRICSNGSIA